MPNQRITIVSWNVSENEVTMERMKEFLTAVASAHPRTICLQEFPARLLDEFRAYALTHGLAVTHEVDKVRLQKDGLTRTCYLVTLSESRIIDSQSIELPRIRKRPLLARMFLPALRALKVSDDQSVEAGGQSVLLEVGDKNLKVLNAHITLLHPNARRAEFDRFVQRVWTVPTVICGDLNVLEGLFGRAGNLLFCGSIRHALFLTERRSFNKRLREKGLVNPLAGRKTHKAGQLDHILYNLFMGRLTISTRKVYDESFGSDHNPVSVTLELR